MSDAFVWYADHPTLGEIQIEASGRVELILGRRATLFSPRMCVERLKSPPDSSIRKCQNLELCMGAGIGMIPPEVRAECSIQVKIPDLEAALLMALNELGDDGSERQDYPMRDSMSEHLSAWVIKKWDEATSAPPEVSPRKISDPAPDQTPPQDAPG